MIPLFNYSKSGYAQFYIKRFSLSNISTENIWTIKKTNRSIKLDFNGDHAFQLNLSDYGEKCEEISVRNVVWMSLQLRYTNVTDFQYRPHFRG